MARTSRFTVLLMLTLLFSFLCYFNSVLGSNDNAYPSETEITQWASDLDLRLTSVLEKISGIGKLEESFGDLKQATLVPIDGSELVHKLSRELTKRLQRKMEALQYINPEYFQRLVNKAEDIVSKYKYDQTLTLNDVSWISVKTFKSEDDPRLEFSEKFRKGVNYSYSGVHIPIEIYEGYPEILNGLNWSDALDSEFRKNSLEDPDLLWQYFGSQKGFMRTYPANRWVTSSGYPDLFDVRRRPWYIHGSSSPKDMLILMDISGSMHGQTMEIMKISVKTLLNTLGEDDFVNVAWFSNETAWASCFTTFVQATRRNKWTLFQDIDKLKDGNMASLSIGLKFAFTQFEMFEKNRSEWEGSNCHKVIVVFTDGGTEEAWDVLNKYNPDKKVRIFTFAVGPHPVPYATLKGISCANKGYFSSVPSMGATRIRVQDYVKVLSRPMVLSNQKEFQWTNFYLDVSGLGVLTTVTLPVFNRSDPRNDSMVGVMGVDVTVQELMDLEPKYQMGPGGYSFAINHNGLVVFHPDLEAQIIPRLKSSNILDDSPYTDILDLEVETEDRNEVRNSMIDLSTGNKIVNGIIELPDMKHAIVFPLKYFYTPINQTQFSLGMVMHINRTHYINAKPTAKSRGLGLQHTEKDEIILAPWKYCHNEVLLGNMSFILDNLTKTCQTDTRKCDNLLLERMIWDIDRTRSVVDYWKAQEARGDRIDVVATFVCTDGGITRTYPPREMVIMDGLTDPRQDLYYKRALFAPDFIFLLPRIYDFGNETRALVTYVKAMRLMKGGKQYVPGVAGAILDENLVQTILQATPASKIPGSKLTMHCSQTNTVLCYLLDDGGFIIASNQVDQPFVAGQFLADSDPALMHELDEKEIYNKIRRVNHDDNCRKQTLVSAAGSHTSVRRLYAVFDVLAWFWEILFCLSSWLWPSAQAASEFAMYASNYTSCSTEMARYYIDKKQSVASNFTCQGLTRHYSVAHVGLTNLILVVTNYPFLCKEKPPPLQTPREVIPPDVCNPEVRYRRRPGICFAHHPNDNSTECGSAGSLGTPTIALFMQLTSVVALYQHF